MYVFTYRYLRSNIMGPLTLTVDFDSNWDVWMGWSRTNVSWLPSRCWAHEICTRQIHPQVSHQIKILFFSGRIHYVADSHQGSSNLKSKKEGTSLSNNFHLISFNLSRCKVILIAFGAPHFIQDQIDYQRIHSSCRPSYSFANPVTVSLINWRISLLNIASQCVLFRSPD
jgi:hypothetical protein